MKLTTAFALGVSAFALASAANAQDIRIDNALGTIVWETGSSLSVTVDNPAGHVDTPEVRRSGDGFIVDGPRRDGYRSCRTSRSGELQIKLSRFGDYVDASELPVIRVTAPADVSVEITDSTLHGRIGDLGSADIEQDGCADLRVGDIAGDAELNVNGSGSITAGAIGGSGELRVNGSGDLVAGAVAGPGEAFVNGSGDLEATAFNSGGRFEVNGSGDMRFGLVTGPVVAQVNGSGELIVEDGEASSFKAHISGSGDIDFGGHVVDPDINIVGSGDVVVGSQSGNMRVRSIGSGDFQVRG